MAKSTTSSSPSSSSSTSFLKSIILPALAAILLYLLIFHAILPLYRRHRARYSGYSSLLSTSDPNSPSRLTSLLTTTTTLLTRYTPSIIARPLSAISSRVRNSLFFHIFTSTTRNTRLGADQHTGGFDSWRSHYNPEAARHGVNPFIPRAGDNEEDETFDEEEGEGMVGFDVRGRQDAGALPRTGPVDRERYAAVMRPGEGGGDGNGVEEDSGRRLSRELEEGFRDDSDDEEDGGERTRRMSRTRVR